MLPTLRDPSPSPDTLAGAPQARTTDGVTLRPLHALDEFQACFALQADVWGRSFADAVPASLLQVSTHVGGLVLGAFIGDQLVGFVFGLTGVKDDEIVHWSHMLAVRADAREHGIGRQLKEYQRATLAHRGVRREFWTFDPLQARNAHLNVNRLGVQVIDYVVNMYGSTGSPLHFGTATDRLIVSCATTPDPVVTPTSTATPSAIETIPILSPAPRSSDRVHAGERSRSVMIEIPWDIQAIVAQSVAIADEWRLATRQSFQWAFLHGYRVTSLHRDHAASRSFYVLTRNAYEATP
jgi:predicted GNAT superfamily acetyltransferase